MTFPPPIFFFLLLATWFFSASHVFCADTVTEDKTPTLESIARNCMACHGGRGISRSPLISSLVNIDKERFIALLQGYRDGTTPATVMNRLMQGFSDDDIRALADYFQAIDPEVSPHK
ncbi:MAG: hypothetical protein GDA50_05010 [Alphaproteobacteria bacterium GM202ARS2]|nr:hypothetical protein [Alphaproteobacteria bacterium GM202ARS2]